MGWDIEDILYYTVTYKNINDEKKYEVKTYLLGDNWIHTYLTVFCPTDNLSVIKTKIYEAIKERNSKSSYPKLIQL